MATDDRLFITFAFDSRRVGGERTSGGVGIKFGGLLCS
jgi:hypothetical protein